MKVTSPVGEFPYTFERIRFEGLTIVAEGRMGTWPARIEAGFGDIPASIRIGGVTALVVALTATGLRRRSGRKHLSS